jgi:hypothetical protein
MTFTVEDEEKRSTSDTNVSNDFAAGNTCLCQPSKSLIRRPKSPVCTARQQTDGNQDAISACISQSATHLVEK